VPLGGAELCGFAAQGAKAAPLAPATKLMSEKRPQANFSD
jgi:hypothetical protein